MCGIAGILNLSGPAPLSIETLKSMIGIMRYRGPDESGVYIDDTIGMAHTRLSIIDLSGGTQPISNENKKIWVVFNGEIFNYPELREQLITRGHVFSTTSDTEVIVHLYEEKGEACFNELNGQFAIALWDAGTQTLLLARDRAGIRPLHYTTAENRLLFASECKALFTVEGISPEIDPAAIDQTFTFWTTMPGTTVFRNIRELCPGHYMKAVRGRISIHKYWDIPLYPKDRWIDDPPDVIGEKIHELLTDAIRIRLRADVPVGAYLSGGLDSSGITSLVVNNFNNEVRTFGIRFDEHAFDEGAHQRHMVDYLKVNHSEIRASNRDIATHFPSIIWHTERPLLRTAPVPLYLLSGLVRNSNFKVVLTGEGADEVFGGYNIFREVLARKFLARNPDSPGRGNLMGRLYPHIFRNDNQRRALRSFFGQGLKNIDDPLFSHRIRWNNTSRIKRLFSSQMQSSLSGYSAADTLIPSLPEQFSSLDSLGKAQYLETWIFLSNYLLSSQGDRMAMANSVEIRLPYLDYRVMEYAGKISSTWKILGMNEKFILKKSFEKILPPEITSRPKHPYRAPIQQGLYGTKATGYIDSMLSPQTVKNAGIFDPGKIEKLKEKVTTNPVMSEVDGMALAGVLSTQVLYDKFIADFPANRFSDMSIDLVVDKRTGART
ncbi:MAG: asparagine synthase (glutamine-hydrolyzing) [Chitinivibrionales bacterium]|nr:asparagine synthase (glutamine-hydrolyzing) [Chitinivibrionales bacterium]